MHQLIIEQISKLKQSNFPALVTYSYIQPLLTSTGVCSTVFAKKIAFFFFFLWPSICSWHSQPYAITCVLFMKIYLAVWKYLNDIKNHSTVPLFWSKIVNSMVDITFTCSINVIGQELNSAAQRVDTTLMISYQQWLRRELLVRYRI